MAYQKTNISAYQKYAGDGWIIYVAPAANLKSLDWGQMDEKLTFTDRAKAIAQCRIRSSKLHTHTECPQATDLQIPAAQTTTWVSPPNCTEICRLFNNRRGDSCNFAPCKFVHICSECCRRRHPYSRCRFIKRDHPYPKKGDHHLVSVKKSH